jgi:hypothetical protein
VKQTKRNDNQAKVKPIRADEIRRRAKEEKKKEEGRRKKRNPKMSSGDAQTFLKVILRSHL